MNEKKEIQLTAKNLFQSENVKAKFNELLGKRSSAFMTSVLQIVASNKMLATADANSIYHSAAVAATLDLPLNNNLGFAYIVPYNQKYQDENGEWQTKVVAQFQMGYKGFIQLSQRSGQFKTIGAAPIYEGQLTSYNPLFGHVFNFDAKKSEKIIGYAASFTLINGFEKTIYMTVDELTKHGTKFSQTFKAGKGLWKDDFDGMSIKTVLKLLLSKFAPLSIEMQTAVVTDQSIVKDSETIDVDYPDNDFQENSEDKEVERIRLMLSDCKTIQEIEALQLSLPEADIELFAMRKEELRNERK